MTTRAGAARDRLRSPLQAERCTSTASVFDPLSAPIFRMDDGDHGYGDALKVMRTIEALLAPPGLMNALTREDDYERWSRDFL